MEMFSQSCNFLPNKKQSIFSNQPPHNIGLMRNLMSKSYQDSADHIQIGLDLETSKKVNIKSSCRSSLNSRTNIMDFVYSFTETSKLLDKRYISTFSIPTERSKLNCKEIITHCNTMTTIPLARSYLVGGFVGSKSQLGRRRKNDIGKINLWDIIRDLVNLVGNSPANYPRKQNHQSSSSFDQKDDRMQSNIMQKGQPNNSFIGLNNPEESTCSSKQSYADVAKRSSRDHHSTEITTRSEDQPSGQISMSCNNAKSVIEPVFSFCDRTNNCSRDRITSECSADSEDSFIVFECCEDDNLDKEVDSSDDETLSYLDEVSQSDSGIVPSNNSSFCRKPTSKKVRFAEGKSLATVHPMVTWDFAYRMARRGPWEMLARDTERFKLRIARTEAVLKPILDPQHRSVVFRDRFADSVR